MHTPETHCCEPGHAVQARPPVPQAPLVVPAWQTWFASRQPPQTPPVQKPLPLQVLPLEQLAQVTPERPHCVSLVPAAHVPVEVTQPLQVVSTQREAWHVWLPLHAEQLAPPVPHAAVVLPPRHWPVLLQHPAQDAAQFELPPPPPPPPPAPPPVPPPAPPPPPVLPTQKPSWHTWLAAHMLHRLPPEPHAWFRPPGWQAPAASQHPVVQEVALHFGFAGPHAASWTNVSAPVKAARSSQLRGVEFMNCPRKRRRRPALRLAPSLPAAQARR
jgi:hypothetical protein